MADLQNVEVSLVEVKSDKEEKSKPGSSQAFKEDNSTQTCSLIEVKHDRNEKILAKSGISAQLTRNTRVVSDRVIFVDNIADSVGKTEFVEIISEYANKGAVVDIKFLKRTKGSSFAFVEFEFEEDGRAAVKSLNNKDFNTISGKVLHLRASKAENPTEAVSNKNLYVKNIPHTWSNEDLKRRFDRYGSISHCLTLKQPGSTENTGVGFVHYFSTLDAVVAIEEADEKLAYPDDPTSNILEVKFARAKKRKPTRKRRYNNRRSDYRDMDDDNMSYRGYHQKNSFRRNSGGRHQGYPPNEDAGEMWAKMVEIMHNMSMWQNRNPYANQGYSPNQHQNPYGHYQPPPGNMYPPRHPNESLNGSAHSGYSGY